MKAVGRNANLKISSNNSEGGCLNGSGFPSRATLLNSCGGKQRPRKVLSTGKPAHPR
ncbi:hypothetical protein M405DRAFT_808401 [Rhizopogon salebrosus TDB-379]|nr:hypothetical protein M405DRAFT_808401 [Rhizopogon salebrosus TDB-379]